MTFKYRINNFKKILKKFKNKIKIVAINCRIESNLLNYKVKNK